MGVTAVASDWLSKAPSPTEDFITGHARNAWIVDGLVSIYLRHSIRYYQDAKLKTLDIARVNIIPCNWNKGHFRAWFDMALDTATTAGVEAIYVESVFNENLAGFLQRRNFVQHGDYTPPCFIKVIAP